MLSEAKEGQQENIYLYKTTFDRFFFPNKIESTENNDYVSFLMKGRENISAHSTV